MQLFRVLDIFKFTGHINHPNCLPRSGNGTAATCRRVAVPDQTGGAYDSPVLTSNNSQFHGYPPVLTIINWQVAEKNHLEVERHGDAALVSDLEFVEDLGLTRITWAAATFGEVVDY